MECVEARALKTSFRNEMDFKSNPPPVLEDIWVVNGTNEASSSDEFSVDSLFDFSNEDDFLQQREDEEQASSSPKRQKLSQDNNNNNNYFSKDSSNFFDFTSLYNNQLDVPSYDVENLEWLSHFVEDSFSENSTAYPVGKLTLMEKPNFHKLSEPEKPVPAKVRSNRTRTSGPIWSFVSSPSLTESSSSSTSSSSSSSGLSSVFELREPFSVEKPPVKKTKTRPSTDPTVCNVIQTARRCSHCGVTKTPQWRAGPMGTKTLCNACGVRFKSGRLLPEYRPACSPTFSSELHSNNHRKVLEMRHKKESLF